MCAIVTFYGFMNRIKHQNYYFLRYSLKTDKRHSWGQKLTPESLNIYYTQVTIEHNIFFTITANVKGITYTENNV